MANLDAAQLASLSQYKNANDPVGYYTALAQYQQAQGQDPRYAQLALDVVQRDTDAAKIAVAYLQVVAGKEGHPVDEAKLWQISLGLMIDDYEARANASGADLTVNAIRTYHGAVFGQVAQVSENAWTPVIALNILGDNSWEDFLDASWLTWISESAQAIDVVFDVALLVEQGQTLEVRLAAVEWLVNLSLAIGAAFFVNEPIIVSGSNGKELLIGDDVANSLIGAANGETIIGGTGDDFLAGNGGDDKLHGGDGEDDLDGGLGNDKIWGDFDNDSLTGGDGADELYGGPGNDILKGDAGDDYLFGGVGNDTLIGGSGADVLDGGTDSNGLDQDTADYSQDTSATAGITVTAGAQAGETSVAAGGATDTLTAIEIIKGTAANDTFKGAAQGVTFDGGGGLNTADFSLTASVQATGITGGGYNVVAGGVAYTLKSIQTFIGTEGKDEFGAQGEAVTFWGEGGDDTLLGSTQNDILLGGDGNDTLFGAAGDDLLGGGYGRDIFLIGQGHDEIVWLSREDFVSTGTRTSVSSWSMDTWGGNPISGGDFLDNPEAAASRMGWSVKDKGSGWVLLEDQANPNNTVKINGKFKKDDDPNGNNPSTPPSGEIDLPDPQPAEGSFGLVDAGPAGMGDNGAGGLPGSNVSSPLVIDLDGDGIELITLSQSRAFFDLEGDGMAQHTGWVAPDDALLAIDRNNNGTIDDGTELFGNTNGFEEGFRALSEYDSNLDGVIDADDQAFGQFLLWQDLDGDGRVSDGELSTAASRGLTSIPLNFTATNYTLNEALISGEANVTWASSGQTKIVDAWFSFSAANAFSSSTTSVAVSDSEWNQITSISDLRGWGHLTGLHEAMASDATFRQMVEDFVDLGPTQSRATYETAIENILYQWAGTTSIATDSRGSHFDGRKLETMEEIWGAEWSQPGIPYPTSLPGPTAALLLESAWDQIFGYFYERLLFLGPLQDASPYEGVDYLSGEFVPGDANNFIDFLVSNAPTDVESFADYWGQHLKIINKTETQSGIDHSFLKSGFDLLVSSAPTGAGAQAYWDEALSQIQTLAASTDPAYSRLLVGSAREMMVAVGQTAHASTLGGMIVGSGTVTGTSADEFYYFSSGLGNVTITETASAGIDTIVFGTGQSQSLEQIDFRPVREP